MLRPAENEIALFRYRNRLTAGVCASVAGTKARFKTREGDTVNVPLANIIVTAGESGRGAKEAEAWWAAAEQRGAKLDFEALWALVRDEGHVWTVQELSEFVTDGSLPEVVAAIQIGIDTCEYFEGVRDGYRTRSAEEVAAAREAREAAEAKAEERDLLGAWIEGGGDGEEVKRFLPEWEERLKDFVLQDGGGVHAGWLERAVGRPVQPRRVFERLVQVGVWGAHEHLDLGKFEVPTAFDAEAVREAECARFTPDATRTDLTGLRVFTIDEETTRDIDDGLSLEPLADGGARIGVHIADASAYVIPGSALDATAADRMTSLYFPDRKVPMLPGVLSEGVASLVEGEDRAAVSTLVTVDSDGRMRASEIVRSVVRVGRRMSYAEADDVLGGKEDPDASLLRRLHAISEGMMVERRGNGAVQVENREVIVHVEEDGSLRLAPVNGSSASAALVSEMMVLAGRAAAAFGRDRNVPLLYRTQKAPDVSDLTEQDDEILYRYKVLQRIRPASFSTTPEPHGALGLDAYCQATSPIRRYADLVVQRQIVAHLRGETPPLDADGLRAFLLGSEDRVRQLTRIERRRKHYWLLEYVRRNPGEVFDAVVLEHRDRETWVDVDQLGLQAGVRPPVPDAPGNRIRIQAASVDPREGAVTFRSGEPAG